MVLEHFSWKGFYKMFHTFTGFLEGWSVLRRLSHPGVLMLGAE